MRIDRDFEFGGWYVTVEPWGQRLRRVTWRREIYGHPHMYRDVITPEQATEDYIRNMRELADQSVKDRPLDQEVMELVSS